MKYRIVDDHGCHWDAGKTMADARMMLKYLIMICRVDDGHARIVKVA